jgi:LmbE family N-acetylglucosaminyl deacetylase
MHPSKRARSAVLAPMALTLLLSTANAAPTLRPSQPDGARLERWLDRLLVVGGVLYVAAHPDDENTRLLAYLSNHSLLRTGYLSVTRGDGGQNLIGPELGPGLGLIRTQELLAARALDGAEQLFTRARDFGYSKSPEESLRIWGEEAMLADVVLAIRRLRPDVIITRFPQEAGETHGQHTASARLAVEAFTRAADPTYMPDAEHRRLGPWKARRVVWNESGFFGKTDAQLAALPHLDVGGYDAWLGLSYPELAADSRSNHRSQGFGAPRRRGPTLESFHPLGGEPMKGSPLDGVVTDWSRVPGSARLVAELKRARQAFRTATPEASIPALLAARAELRRMPDNPWKQTKLAELDATVLACAGLFGDVIADRTSTSPGGSFTATTTVLLRRPARVTLTSARLGSRQLLGSSELKAGVPVEAKTSVEVPADTRLSSPAWLEAPEAGLYPVRDPAWIGLPEEPAPLEAELTFGFGSESITLRRPVAYKWTDPVLGERYRRLEVLPPVTVDASGGMLLFPDASPRPLDVTVRSVRGASGTLALELPPGFSAQPATAPFNVAAGSESTVRFTVTPPRTAARGTLRAVATVNGQRFDRGLRRIDHSHIPIQTWLPPATVQLTRVDVAHAKRRIGYLSGPGDEVPEALRQAGYDVTPLSVSDLREGGLGRFDAVVFGIRAFNVEPQLQALHAKLMDYVASGGTVLVQYVTSNFISRAPPELGPFPFTIGQGRVTDETATVEADGNPVLSGPNRIGPDDWAGWVQERGLYFAESWDPRYATPLSMHDPGEAPLKGSVLVARSGKGAFVYTGLSFFRQLPAGVPGAFRLFANLVDAGG